MQVAIKYVRKGFSGEEVPVRGEAAPLVPPRTLQDAQTTG